MTRTSGPEPESDCPAAIHRRIQEALPELTSPRIVDILLVVSPETYCDPLLLALAALGHRVVIARSSQEALKNFYDKTFALVICDRASENSGADEFAPYVRSLDPRQRILLMDFAPHPSPNATDPAE
jgi:PleD family two-component response regulator